MIAYLIMLYDCTIDTVKIDCMTYIYRIILCTHRWRRALYTGFQIQKENAKHMIRKR